MMHSIAEDHGDQNPINSNAKSSLKLKWSKNFPVIGKGTLFFHIDQKSPIYMIVRPKVDALEAGDSWIGLYVGEKEVSFLLKKKNQEKQILCSKSSDEKFFGSNVGIQPGEICTYWLSYDSDRMVIRYGKGYCMEKTSILEYHFDNSEENETDLFDPSVSRKIELHYEESHAQENTDHVDADTSMTVLEPEVEFDPNPLVSDIKPLVKDSSKANLFYLDEGDFMYSSNLPPACQMLYANVTAADVDLDFVPPDVKAYKFLLTDAIRYSIETEGCALNKKLHEKKEFGDPSLTYLRVTLGKEYGNSPGVPYVLEIWPKSHGSPVHNHGNAYAVIRVLHGGLTIHYYNKMAESVTTPCGNGEHNDPSYGMKELGHIDVKKGDVTWISPRWYQTHRLQNDTEDFCATVQCYAYGNNDHTHWPYFDYLKSCSRIAEFKPDSDFRFREMYNIVMEEYAQRKKVKAPKKLRQRKTKQAKKQKGK